MEYLGLFQYYYRITTVLILVLQIASGQEQAQYAKEWTQKYEDTIKEIQARNRDDIIDKIPGFECSARPEWPGPRTSFEFTCEILPPSDVIPTSVHRLRPADIKVIAAFGDSLTAANGAKACFLPELALQYRGRTFSHGGDFTFEKNPSMANILRKFNPDLKGYGNGTGWWYTGNAGMNVGQPGAKADDTIQQARNLVTKMKTDISIDYENDWKVVTVFVGGNDACDWCKDTSLYHPDMYVENIRQALMILRNEMPRAFVNVVSPLRVDAIRVLRGTLCDTFHYIFCPCVINVGEKELIKVQQTIVAYQRNLEELINSGYFDKDDFTVILQPFFENTVIPSTEDGNPDHSFFAPDCFHLSSKGHAAAGKELWNNMIEPVGNKRREWVIDGPLVCPSQEFPYLRTNINSAPDFAVMTTENPDTVQGGSAIKQSLDMITMLICGTCFILLNNAW